MRKKLTRDKKIRKGILENAQNTLLRQVLFNNRILPLKLRKLSANNIKKAQVKSITEIRNYCQITGRARGVLPTWRVSRIVFKSNADLGLIPGVRGAS